MTAKLIFHGHVADDMLLNFVICSVQIVEVALRQGLVHPITCVPYLIALETDPLEVNSKLSHHLLMNMNEKYGPETLLFFFICLLLLFFFFGSSLLLII